jgi:hypothetical protein
LVTVRLRPLAGCSRLQRLVGVGVSLVRRRQPPRSRTMLMSKCGVPVELTSRCRLHHRPGGVR